MKNFFSKLGFWGRLLALIIMSLLFLILAILFGGIFSFVFFGQQAMISHSIPYVLFLQAFTSIGVFVVPALMLCFLVRDGNFFSRIDMTPAPYWKSVLLCIFIILTASPLVSWLEELNLRMVLPDCMQGIENWMRQKENDAAALTKTIIESENVGRYIANIFIIAFLPALSEELYFRVALQETVICDKTNCNKYVAAVIAAVVFSAIHLQFFGFLPRFLLGFLLGIMLIITGNIWCSIIAHFVNNFAAVTLAFLNARGVAQDIEEWQCGPLGAILSALSCGILIFLLYKTKKIIVKFVL